MPSVLLQVDDVMMRRSVFWQVTCFLWDEKQHAGSTFMPRY
jgi:hypothetical protein